MLKDISHSFTYLPEDIQIRVYERFKKASVRDKFLFYCVITHGDDMKYMELGNMLGINSNAVAMTVKNILKGRTDAANGGTNGNKP